MNWCLVFIRNQSFKAMQALCVGGLCMLFTFAGAAQAQEEINAERSEQLGYMLKHDCGSCHGMTLKGGLGPALLPELLQGKGHTVDSLSVIIRSGVPGTAMPPWGPILKEEDIRWLSTHLLQSDLN
ncbi:MAG: cytochrome c [Motiliproteus sp.]